MNTSPRPVRTIAAVFVLVVAGAIVGCPHHPGPVPSYPPAGDPIVGMQDPAGMPAPLDEDEIRSRLRAAVEQELGTYVWSSDAGPELSQMVEQSAQRLIGIQPNRTQLAEVEKRLRRFAKKLAEKSCAACLNPNPTRERVQQVRSSICPIWPIC